MGNDSICCCLFMRCLISEKNMQIDLHVHSKYSSDGILDPEKIVKIGIKRGLHGIAITDHDSIIGALKAKRYETDDFKVIIGSEISTTQGEIIGLFIKEKIKESAPIEVMDEIRAQDGMVIIPHPFDIMRKGTFQPKKEHTKKIHKIEVFNSRCVNREYNQKALDFAKKYSLGFTAGSDAHFASEIGKAGIIIKNLNIRQALQENDYQIYGQKSGVFYHGMTKALKLWRKARYG